MHFEDFVLQISARPDTGYAVKVLKSPAGEGSGTLRLPDDIGQLDEWAASLEHTVRGAGGTRDATALTSSHAAARDLTPSGHFRMEPDLNPQHLGDALYRAVFSGQIRTLYDQSRGSVGSSGDAGLRIKLKLDPADHSLAALHGLPWELLHRTDTQDFLGLDRASPIVRYLDVPRPTPVIPLPKVLRILVVISSPSDLATLDLARERHHLESVLGEQPGVEVVFLERASIGALRKALLEKPFHVLHFMGHGGFESVAGEGVLYFEAADGGSDPVSGQALATKLKDVHSLGLIFLNACNTARATGQHGVNPFAGVANALVLGGLPAVLAMQLPISDLAAIAFSEAFYRRLASGESVDEALTEGRQAVHSLNPASAEWSTPVLFVRVPDGTIFQASQPTSSRAPKRWAGIAAALVLALTLALGTGWQVFRQPSGAQLADGSFRLQADQPFVTTVDGLTGRLVTVDILPDGTMKLNFEFENTTDTDVDLDFHLARTYLADDSGNRYGVRVADPDQVPGESFAGPPSLETVPAGDKVRYQLEFDAPQDGAQMLNVGLASDRDDPDLAFFQVDLGEVPKQLTTPVEAFVAEEGSALPELAGTTFESDVEGFDGTLARVELLPGGRMRWDLEFFNRSGNHQQLNLNYDRIYLADEHGNEYRVTGSSTGAYAGGASNGYRGLVQRAVKVRQWLEFSAPIDKARQFMLVLLGADGQSVGFRHLETRMASYAARYSVDRPKASVPSSDLLGKPVSIENNLSGLVSQLTAIEPRPGGRMRWWLSFRNRSARDLRVGLNFPRIYLADAAGHRYGVRATSPPANPRKAIELTLRRGLGTQHWMEFEGPRNTEVKSFSVWLFAPGPKAVAFNAFEVGPLTYPTDFPIPAPPKDASGTPYWLAKSFKTNISGLDGTLTRAELPAPDRLRLHFELFNRSTRDQIIGFDYGATRIHDAGGTTYPVLGSDTGASSGSYSKDLQRAIKSEHWIEVQTPAGGEQEITIALTSHRPEALSFPPLRVTLNLPTRAALPPPPPRPPASFVLLDGEQEMPCDLPGLKAKLTTIDRLANGRLRWHFELVNTGTSSLEIGFDTSQTYLSDNLGNTYKVLAADTNLKADRAHKIYRAGLQPGETTRHWFEFSGPINGASRFIAVVTSHDVSKLRFQPMATSLD